MQLSHARVHAMMRQQPSGPASPLDGRSGALGAWGLDGPLSDDARAAEVERVAIDVGRRVAPVCDGWDASLLDALVHRIAHLKVRWAEEERRRRHAQPDPGPR